MHERKKRKQNKQKTNNRIVYPNTTVVIISLSTNGLNIAIKGRGGQNG